MRILAGLLMTLVFMMVTTFAFAQSKARPPAGQAASSQRQSPQQPPMPKQVKRATLIVFGVVPEKGIEKGAANLLTELIINRVSAMGKYEVIGQKDLDKMLSWEQSKQLNGCTDTQCLIQLAGAMGAEYYIEGSVGAVGEQYIVTLKFMDSIKVKIIERETIRVIKDEKILADAMERLVDKIMGLKVDFTTLPTSAAAADASSRQTAMIKAEAKEQQERKSQLRIAGMACTFTGLGVVVLGGVFNGLAVYETTREKSANNPSTMQDARDKAHSYGITAIAGYSVGGVAFLSGVVMWVVSAKMPNPVSASISIVPVFDSEGGGVMIGGGW